MSNFEKWAENYGLRYETNFSKHTEADCKAAYAAGVLEGTFEAQPAPQGVTEVMEMVGNLPYRRKEGSGLREYDAIEKAITALVQERDTAASLAERLKLEAQIHAQEARTANATIAEIYQLVSGATGEPGNWRGAEPVRELVRERDALKARVAEIEGDVARAERFAKIGCAVERAAASLPEGYGLRIELEKGAGSIYLTNDDGNEIELPDDSSEPFGSQIEAAIDAAVAASQEAP